MNTEDNLLFAFPSLHQGLYNRASQQNAGKYISNEKGFGPHPWFAASP
jgi:hypothetical protein